VSSRHTRGFFGVMLAVVFALSAVIVAPASAKLTKSQKAHMRHQLRKQIKKNPKLIRNKSFIKKASLVNFKLPVTIRLRDINPTTGTNPNNATIDLGASLGQREVDLGGSLAAEIVFHDSYDGGALGNVDINILESSTKNLTSTSIPLLWNTDVSRTGTSWDSTLLKAGGFSDAQLTALGHAPGCGDIHNANENANGNVPFGLGALNADGTPNGTGTGPGLAGVPIYPDLATYASHGTPLGFAPAHLASTSASVDNSIDAITASKIPGNNNNVGGNPQPFPYAAQSVPGGFVQPPSPKDTVLRTNALKLGIAHPGTEVNNATGGDAGVNGSQNTVIGKSGGQANLFGNIPGKGYGIDVTVNLATRINSILRIEDQDAFEPLIAGANWPAAVFSCAQVWTGGIQNYIPAVHLDGNLKISPGITADGHLRIAKATLDSNSFDPARFAVAACLAPKQAYNTEVPANYAVPTPGAGNVAADGSLLATALPADSSSIAPAPAGDCNSAPSPLVANSALPTSTVQALTPALGSDGYTVNPQTGASVSVAADLKVNKVVADVLVGDV
jgi:hypothetical protein